MAAALARTFSVVANVIGVVMAVIGAGVAWIFFNGDTVSSVSGSRVPNVIFQLRIGPRLVLTGMLWAFVAGLVGGLFPAVRGRLPVVAALRAT